jgi:hypothetical protein
MVVHIVSFKYRPEVEAAAREGHRGQLRGLSGLEGVLDLKVGEDFVRNERSYDTGLLVLFRDRAALEEYARHPRHVPVAQLGRDLSAHIVAVDFDA